MSSSRKMSKHLKRTEAPFWLLRGHLCAHHRGSEFLSHKQEHTGTKGYAALLSLYLRYSIESQTKDASEKTVTSVCNYTPAGITIIRACQCSYSALLASGIITCSSLTQSYPFLIQSTHSFHNYSLSTCECQAFSCGLRMQWWMR